MTIARSEKELSILLPAYNEAVRIEKCVREVERVASSFSDSYEIIVAEDGSTDGTDRIITSLSRTNPCLSFLHSPVRLGKGKAIKRALRAAKGAVVVFMDVDLSVSLDFLPRIVELAKKCRGLVIGSRHVKGSRVARSFSRTLYSLSYNLLVRLLFFDGVHDHQCGFKAMSHEVAEFLRENTRSEGLFLDTEMILRCKRAGFPVIEVGVDWSETRKRSESSVRLFHDSLKMGLELLRFRLNGGAPSS